MTESLLQLRCGVLELFRGSDGCADEILDFFLAIEMQETWDLVGSVLNGINNLAESSHFGCQLQRSCK